LEKIERGAEGFVKRLQTDTAAFGTLPLPSKAKLAQHMAICCTTLGHVGASTAKRTFNSQTLDARVQNPNPSETLNPRP